MCGITGFVDFTKRSTQDDLLAMTRSLVHRGPDDEGIEKFETESASVGLGFRRLAILDLSPGGHQPMALREAGLWIIFNGEVYNFQELRAELIRLGHVFSSRSDTEVVLHAYQQWGREAVKRFRGMFAICIYDTEQRKLFFARDRAGIKPLYYYYHDGLFLFASELKAFHEHPAFHPEMDPDALALYFQLGYVPSPYAIFKHSHKLPPGHTLELSLDTGKESLDSYWEASTAFRQPKLEIPFEEAVVRTEEVLRESFDYRMIADVPVGVFLSGGYDSSCVAALLRASGQPLKTFTIGFEEQAYNEADHARLVANHLGTDHHEYRCTYREAMDIVPSWSDIYDEPFGDSSGIPTTLVSRFARQQVTVALSADAGDELFAGYPRHRKNVSYQQKLHYLPGFISRSVSRWIPSRSSSLEKADRLGKLKAVLSSNDPVARFASVNQVFTPEETRQLLKTQAGKGSTVLNDGVIHSLQLDTLSSILLAEYKTYLVDDILQKVDRATMSASLEGREPFLDHHIQEWVARLPNEYKMNASEQKVLLKAIVHRHIPKEIMARPKMGFGIPLVRWMKEDLRPLFDDVMSDESIQSTGCLDLTSVIAIRDAYLQGRLENFERLWFVFSFILWHRRWMGKPTPKHGRDGRH